jgi:hypothetical protein
MKELLARQAQCNAALDLDKNEKQVAPSAEEDVVRVGEVLQVPSIPPRVQRNSVPSMSP